MAYNSTLVLSDQELSALIEACNVTDAAISRRLNIPRPPWNTDGSTAWKKLIKEEMRRGDENHIHKMEESHT